MSAMRMAKQGDLPQQSRWPLAIADNLERHQGGADLSVVLQCHHDATEAISGAASTWTWLGLLGRMTQSHKETVWIAS